MGRMFKTVTKTWNPFTGCAFDCIYCWARGLATGRLKYTARYSANGFKPAFHSEELKKKFKLGEFIFVSSMGDLTFCPSPQLDEILRVITDNPQTNFLIQTKGAKLYRRNGAAWPLNVYHGATIETNRDISKISKAPPTHDRFQMMTLDPHPCKFISIEPIMDFDPWFVGWILGIMPEIVEIGADNHNHNLPEPSWDKVERLMTILREAGVKVVEKDGLNRLTK